MIEPAAAITFLNETARYFESRPTGGEDRAHWANVYNSQMCHLIAEVIAQVGTRPEGGDCLMTTEPSDDLSKELEAGKSELLRLMDAIWRGEFRQAAPNWKPLSELPGMVSQIDNMYAGVREQRDKARWDLAEARTQVDAMAGALEALLADVGDVSMDGYHEGSIHSDEVTAARQALSTYRKTQGTE